MPHIENNAVWDIPPRADKVFSIRISRNTLIGLIFSILVHLALLWFFAPKLFNMGAPAKEAPPFQVTLGPPQKQETAKSEPAAASAPPVQPAKPQPEKVIRQKSVPPKQVKPLETAKKSDLTVPKPPEKPAEKYPDKPLDKSIPKPATKPVPDVVEPFPGEDMQAFMSRRRAAKLAQQGASEQDIQEILASGAEPSAGSKRDAKIKENLKLDGSNGIFQIREMGLHHAQFSFKGWKNNINNARLEVIDVDVPDGSDGKHEVIKKMIEIIRREYSGDFNWESWRQQRVLVLSARAEDTAALESFLMNEIEWPR